VNTGAGCGGDRFDIAVTAGEDAQLLVGTTAAEKIYRSLGPATAVTVRLALAGGARAALAAAGDDPVRPRAPGRGIEVEMEESASLLLAESLCFGRSPWERRSNTGCRRPLARPRGGQLVFAESLRLDGPIARRLAEPAVAAAAARSRPC